MNPMFSNTVMKGMYYLMVEELKELNKYLNEQDLRQSININDIFQKVALVRLNWTVRPKTAIQSISFSGCFNSCRVWN